MTVAGSHLRAPDLPEEELVDFGAALLRISSRYPENIAVIDEAGVTTWSEFTELCTRVAARLVTHNVGPGDTVTVLAENSGLYLALYCGTIMAGACITPLPTGARADALTKMQANSGARIMFASAGMLETAQGLGAPELELLEGLNDWAGEITPIAPVPAQADAMFDIIYSSGTTGTPKGIVHDHRFRARQLNRMPQFGLDADAILMTATPLYSNTTLVAVLPVLSQGGTVVVMSKFNEKRFLELSEQHRATHAMLVPVQYMRLMDFPDFDRFDLSAYRAKLSTSAPLPRPLIERVLARWPGGLYEFYGMTEGGVSTVLDCAGCPDKLDTVGKPAEGCQVEIIDEDGNPLPQGELGEVVGRAGSMMPCYYKEAQKTDELRWQNAAGEDFIRTGDIGRIDTDGFLTLLDRQKDVVNSGGQNVYAADLEQVLRDHPGVADVAVIAVPCAKWGETPLGLVVPASDQTETEAAILGWANDRLGKMQRLSAIEFRKNLPRSEIGKILKRDLRADYWPDK